MTIHYGQVQSGVSRYALDSSHLSEMAMFTTSTKRRPTEVYRRNTITSTVHIMSCKRTGHLISHDQHASVGVIGNSHYRHSLSWPRLSHTTSQESLRQRVIRESCICIYKETIPETSARKLSATMNASETNHTTLPPAPGGVNRKPQGGDCTPAIKHKDRSAKTPSIQ